MLNKAFARHRQKRILTGTFARVTLVRFPAWDFVYRKFVPVQNAPILRPPLAELHRMTVR